MRKEEIQIKLKVPELQEAVCVLPLFSSSKVLSEEGEHRVLCAQNCEIKYTHY